MRSLYIKQTVKVFLLNATFLQKEIKNAKAE